MKRQTVVLLHLSLVGGLAIIVAASGLAGFALLITHGPGYLESR